MLLSWGIHHYSCHPTPSPPFDLKFHNLLSALYTSPTLPYLELAADYKQVFPCCSLNYIFLLFGSFIAVFTYSSKHLNVRIRKIIDNTD